MIVGAGAGVLAGLLGVGGGIILVPAFYYLFSGMGYEPPQLMQICVATSLATITFTSLRSMNGHRKKGAVDDAILKSCRLYTSDAADEEDSGDLVRSRSSQYTTLFCSL